MQAHNMVCKVRKAAKIRNRYNQVPHLTQDTTLESNKNTIKHHKQEVGPFPAGAHNVLKSKKNGEGVPTRSLNDSVQAIHPLYYRWLLVIGMCI